MESPTGRLWGRVAPVALGLAAGTLVVTTSRNRHSDLWPVWGALALALTGCAGLVFHQGLAQWRALPEDERRPRHEITAIAAGLVVLAVLDALASQLLNGWSAWRAPVLVGTALIGAIPVVWVALAIRHAALTRRSGSAGERAEWLLTRRRQLRSLLAGLGSLVALSTLALGAAIRVENDLVKTGRLAEATRPEVVLIFGGVGSLLVAVVYAPAALALRARARELSAELFPLFAVDEGGPLLERAEQRARFDQLTGAEAGAYAELQAGIVVFAPLLASAASVWLPR
ncbi:hypothetical protein [Streptomyces sp. NPDC005408]|uniref:hypothetical protein n=1 Tax=Streptomyces sp. NPDC005408 TaxID=3155341 RepID=UPI0033B891C0